MLAKLIHPPPPLPLARAIKNVQPGNVLGVSNPFGIPHANSQLASRAACSICSRVASGLPYAILEAIVPVKRTGSWGTMPMTLRQDSAENSLMSGCGKDGAEFW